MLQLPDFPWDTLAPVAELAKAHSEGFIDLSVGSPVDSASRPAQVALSSASDAHGYPATVGTVELREAIVSWYRRRRGVELGQNNVLPTIGSKEFITTLPLVLGLGAGDVIVYPQVSYPSYAIGAEVVHANAVAEDDPKNWPSDSKLIWLNSPGNPDGRVRSIAELDRAVSRARELDAVIVSDECYAELNWESNEPSPSILDPRVIGESRHNILSVYSLSKQSNLAGYRAGIVAGCSQLLAGILAIRKHLGFMVPAPVQAAMIAALNDDATVSAQREVYRKRRELLSSAILAAGLEIDFSQAGIYLWVRGNTDSWDLARKFANLGILVTPGTFYADSSHVRIALTASTHDIETASKRLKGFSK